MGLGFVFRTGQSPDFRRSTHGQGIALTHDEHPVAVFGFFHEVGGYNYGHPLFGKTVDPEPELPACKGIDPVKWARPGRVYQVREARLLPWPGAACCRPAVPGCFAAPSAKTELFESPAIRALADVSSSP